jgi:hypothetical protein
MSGKPALLAQPISRHDDDDRAAQRQAAKNRHDKAEGSRERACRRGDDFMQRSAGQAAFRKTGIKRGQTERQGLVSVFTPTFVGRAQQATQFRHDGGAVLRWEKRTSRDNSLDRDNRFGKCNGRSHLAVSSPATLNGDKGVYVLCMFKIRIRLAS